MSFNLASPGAPVLVSFASLTDVGRQRQLNQDSLLCQLLAADGAGPSPDGAGPGALLLAVCDGMGGGQGGEVASGLATTALGRSLLAGPLPASEPELATHLAAAIEGAHHLVRATAARQHMRDMGTTATAVLIRGGQVLVGQVGDSRAYLLRDGQLRQLTRDQSLAQQMIELGQLRPEERRTFEHGNIILQALGTSSSLEVDLTGASLRRGDVLLLCSDGLWGELEDEQMAALVAGSPDPAEACRRLIEAANDAGGSDNVSCIVCRFDGAGLPLPDRDEALPGYQKLKFPIDPPAAPGPSQPADPSAAAPAPSVISSSVAPASPRSAGSVGLPHPPTGIAPSPTLPLRDLGPIELPLHRPPLAGLALLLATGAALAAMLWRCVG